ncbi:hypothetical protein FNO01nite_00250 [Flavobacterium noncentrifugens]|uniref:Susd and RagB outer membrane lipoprotein n=1 Tax=Flavobacterium noncentrifugens TaxID=1128970 RepID=A0A1G8RBD4_9FLAO|nr:SusD/RagB family nutrient-binding outer membrane lipoprotein [Flavobacterium noncentrifugens]GEP49353.1 hypothetical protein FNO01nite_00250 [Flavobacterium noncentrifugens]SDJ13835.1 Susd and RagB outer membrane lipoprotein [Flavobacterium noncentrifugens]
MKNKIFSLFLLALVFTIGGCETFDLDQLDNPSKLPKEQLEPVSAFNYVQLTLPDFVDSNNGFTQRAIRQMAMTGGNTYENAFTPIDFDNNWTTAYLILNTIKSMEPKAIENDQKFILGASKIIRSYILMTMVDTYGDIPYSEALQGNANLRPRYDNSEAVYAGIYDELNQAIEYLTASDEALNLQPRDLYYGNSEGKGDKSKWITLAKTLKFKMLYNASKIGHFGGVDVNSQLTLLLQEDDLIKTAEQDFAFKYGTERDAPNSRHPLYNDQYEFGTGAYIANYFFWAVSVEKNKGPEYDPREEFYFFKQARLNAGNTTSQSLPCKTIARPAHYSDPAYASFYNTLIPPAYCTSDGATGDASYLGRDHGDRSGLPQDDEIRSLVGVYPAGGAIGPEAVVSNLANAGLKGALGQGIMPMVLSSYVSFMKAELALTLGLGGDPAALLEDGIRKSISKTTTFLPAQAGAPSQAVTTAKTTAYVAFVLSVYNDPLASAAKKLELIIKEYYIATWGNGIEPYNNYRRTGYPSNLQPTLEENPGPFFSTALYPYVSVNNNPNAPSNIRTKKVFWDVSGITLH